MIADVLITEKSFGDKHLMSQVSFSVDDGEKVGLVGRNGVGKSTLFGMLAGTDDDYTGQVVYRRGITVAATAQEHHGLGDVTVMKYVLGGLPEYTELKHIIDTYPETMGDNMCLIDEYTQALERFDQKGFYRVEEKIERELERFGLGGLGARQLSSLSGGQKRLIEIVKIMHAQAHLALIDEPTNHMDYAAKQQFIDWMRAAPEAMLIITHDRDVLSQVDRIVELKDGGSVSYRGNYDAYLKQNATQTAAGMNDFEQVEKRMKNLRQKVLDYQRLKEKSRNPGTIQNFKRLENEARAELAQLEERDKPTFWIDQDSVAGLHYKAADNYQKYKSRTIRLNVKDGVMRSQRSLVEVRGAAVGYGDNLLFEGVSFEVHEGEAVELRGRNGAGKSTLIGLLVGSASRHGLAATRQDHEAVQSDVQPFPPTLYGGSLSLDPHVRIIGRYEQEIAPTYLNSLLAEAIERMYLDRNLAISHTKIRQLAADYLFTPADLTTPLIRLSGGQKARFQLISMLAGDPQLLILDEPTNHLDLPSIEELENALMRYTGAILYVSHDNYFRGKLGGQVVQIGPV